MELENKQREVQKLAKRQQRARKREREAQRAENEAREENKKEKRKINTPTCIDIYDFTDAIPPDVCIPLSKFRGRGKEATVIGKLDLTIF